MWNTVLTGPCRALDHSIYKSSNLLELVVCSTELGWPYMQFLPRTARRRELNVPKLKSSEELTVLIYILYPGPREEDVSFEYASPHAHKKILTLEVTDLIFCHDQAILVLDFFFHNQTKKNHAILRSHNSLGHTLRSFW